MDKGHRSIVLDMKKTSHLKPNYNGGRNFGKNYRGSTFSKVRVHFIVVSWYIGHKKCTMNSERTT